MDLPPGGSIAVHEKSALFVLLIELPRIDLVPADAIEVSSTLLAHVEKIISNAPAGTVWFALFIFRTAN